MKVPIKRFPRRPASNYDNFRQNIEPGDLLLCSGSGKFSRMIQATTGSTWSHVGFVMPLTSINRVMVLESVESIGVRTVPLRKYLNDYDNRGNPYPGGLAIARHDNFSTLANKKNLNKFGQFAVDLFGYPYDTDEIVKIAGRIVASKLRFTKQHRKALKRDREYICSEYVWECYRQVGIHIQGSPSGFIAPSDFAKAKEMKLIAVLKH